jgi:hypothetical protein
LGPTGVSALSTVAESLSKTGVRAPREVQ